MKDFLKTFAAVVLGTLLTTLIGFFLLLGVLSNLIRLGSDMSITSIPDKSVLYLSFEEGLSTQDSDLPVLGFCLMNWIWYREEPVSFLWHKPSVTLRTILPYA